MESLNTDVELSLGHFTNIVNIQSGDWSQSPYNPRTLYCADPRLSLDVVGKSYLALVVDREKTPTLTREGSLLLSSASMLFLFRANSVCILASSQ